MTKLKVVLHINQNERFQHGVDNIKNLLNADVESDISLVLTGECAKFSAYDHRIKDLLNKGVKVSVCRNSLKHFEVAEEDLISGIRVVPAGIVELVEKQAQGYGYIKP